MKTKSMQEFEHEEQQEVVHEEQQDVMVKKVIC
jgi:hypothetical protein